MSLKILTFFAPEPQIELVPASEVNQLYRKYRWSTLESTFLGYAVFYLVRNNLSTVAKDIEGALQYDHNMVGSILAISAITYGLGKFLMGAVSDRSNPRKFMAVACCLPHAVTLLSEVLQTMMFISVSGLNGFIQGMDGTVWSIDWHWFGLKERGSVFAFWNIAHNIGGVLQVF